MKRGFIVLCALLTMSCVCSNVTSALVPTPLPTRADIIPAVGEWKAKAEFGEITFTVDPSGLVSRAGIKLSSSPCVPSTSENSSFSNSADWVIENNAFAGAVEFERRIDIGTQTKKIIKIKFSLTGAFAADFKKASGTWGYQEAGTNGCTDTWEAAK